MSAPLPPWAQEPVSAVPSPGSPLDRQFAAFIGPRWPKYRAKFRPFFEDERFQPTWNWSAALAVAILGPLGGLWFAYRRLVLPAVLFLLLPTFALFFLWNGDPVTPQEILNGSTETAKDFQIIAAGVQLSTTVLAGGTANFLVFRRARAAIRLATRRGLDERQAESLLRTLGRPSWVAVGVMLVLLVLLNQLVIALASVARPR